LDLLCAACCPASLEQHQFVLFMNACWMNNIDSSDIVWWIVILLA
jgi:hypothetical protein